MKKRFPSRSLATGLVIALALLCSSVASAEQLVQIKPVQTGAVVTPSNSATISATSAIYVGVAGDITVDFASGSGTNILLKAVPVGKLDISVTRIYATGTTATNMVALYAR